MHLLVSLSLLFVVQPYAEPTLEHYIDGLEGLEVPKGGYIIETEDGCLIYDANDNEIFELLIMD